VTISDDPNYLPQVVILNFSKKLIDERSALLRMIVVSSFMMEVKM